MPMHTAQIPAELLQRGFWLYVWEIETNNETKVFYVGRTGDSSSSHASAPYSRMSQHLGKNQNNNTLKRHLDKKGLKAKEFFLHAYGPIFPEENIFEEHKAKVDVVAAYEKELCDLLKNKLGLEVLNTVNCNKVLDKDGWAPIEIAFKEKLKKSIKSFEETNEPSLLVRIFYSLIAIFSRQSGRNR